MQKKANQETKSLCSQKTSLWPYSANPGTAGYGSMGNMEQVHHMSSLAAKYIRSLNSHKIQNSAFFSLSFLLVVVIS